MRAGLVFLFLSAVPAAALRFSEDAAARWCSSGLARLRSVLSACSSVFPFPACDLLFFALIVLLLIGLFPRRRAILPWLSGALVIALSLTWTAPCALSKQAPGATADELYALCVRLSAEAAALHEQERTFRCEGIAEYAAKLCQSEIVPKAAAFPEVLKALGLAGWWSPLTGEAVVDMTMSELNLPFALCHELMHARGIAGEAQAHFEAYKACMRGSGAFRYSGAMNALWYAMRALRSCDEARWQELVGEMDAGVLRDFRRMNGLDDAPQTLAARIQDACTQAYIFLSGAQDYDQFALWLANEK